jgi:hypothetical protein
MGTTGQIWVDATRWFGACGYAANAVVVGGRRWVQFHGGSVWSSCDFVRPDTTHCRTSMSQVIGSPGATCRSPSSAYLR